jgi:ABC-type sulfate transport system permease component
MDTQRLDGHKKALGILYIISACFTILGMLVLNAILSLVFAFVFDEFDPEEKQLVELILSIVAYVPAVVITFIVLPTIIAGIGLLAKQQWAVILSLIVGCFKLFSFPIGTAIGVYAIWIFAEDQKLSRNAS